MLVEKELVYQISGCVFAVYKELGHGFLEKVYEKALRIELERQGFTVEVQKPIQVMYKGEVVGDYLADIVVTNKIIIELKAQSNLHKAHETQIINYLKATGIEVGLLVNFAYPKATIKRYVL
ncbi:MAG: GxxExxY protein [Desulfobulbaceae bacterium]|uniref:GxxExxY protein n=1 Tax=Candidatus Desulfobia pelagia TaxID=2841692 RepID=A0A8J6TD22_9BACT|nr:GxxExxY protein [Candidatus Desulfobia pelagia]